MAHETFGQYLLLKKLSEDALGELFRAGRLRDGNLEQVVLLRVYNAPGIDAEALGRGIAAREGVHSVLRSPNLAQGLESGTLQGIPYAIYDYISGRDLGALMQQASHRSHPVPTEHALLIAERLALGLSVAHGSKVGSERVLHGFLVPPMVMLSNEGENRILGFEASPALRAAGPSSQAWSQFSRYLSPETHAGQPLSQGDDVYALGVILLELLVGHSLENLGPSSLQGAVAQVAGRGLPNVAQLIERSIAPANERIDSAAAWHEQLNRLVLDRESSSTPFHLAFYMHNLFRDEIELESQEIEHEKSLDFSREQLSSVPASQPLPPEESAAPLAAGSFAVEAATTAGAPTPPPDEVPKAEPPAPTAKPKTKESSSNKLLWIIPAAVLLLAVGGYFAWQQMSPSSEGTTDRPPATRPEPAAVAAATPGTETADPPTTGAAPTLEGGRVEDARTVAEGVESDTVDPTAAEREGTREELMSELDRLVAERTQAAAEGIKEEYDQEVAELRARLQAAEEERLEQERLEQEAAAARLKAQQEEEARLEQQRQQAAEEERKRKEAEQQAQAQQASAPPERNATNARTVREGELVQPGPGVSRPRLLSELKPVYPFAAQRLRREADVDVDVLVDENGNVVDSRLAKKAGFGFDDAARNAATNAKFSPATTQGVKVKMWTTLKVRFRLDN